MRTAQMRVSILSTISLFTFCAFVGENSQTAPATMPGNCTLCFGRVPHMAGRGVVGP